MPGVAVVIPAWRCQAQLDALLARLPASVPRFVVDDGSDPPLHGATHRHDRNRGYGAAQKTGYAAAIAAGHDRLVLLHGDDQYDLGDTLALAGALAHADAAIGSRFLADPRVIPTWRRWGNRVLTGLANLRYGTAHTELHTGARAYRAEALLAVGYGSLSDDYLFDQQVLCRLLRRGSTIAERPVHTRYDDATQSIPLGKAVRYAAGCVGTILTT